ncbi:LacI family DNA-binding transcriptional regulator [Paenibacillus sp.]|uniref:LacI family DNA-binding transcriptional regulator n=1 Tax=Paenibacillus sp. TaxID=58172 RepID=UPI002D6643AF|nr:LacI family DNA-binding transcriptional regulator [Paenibacillus sp.]HZG57081.1 LacI family DNA-binding transcriptional regulator [Paenibacillus sp.]
MNKLTVKDVAREAGVSTATVSRVLNRTGYVSEPVREQVLSVVERLNFRPNSIARSLKQDRSNAIGLIVPDMTNPYFMTVARRLQKTCVGAGFHLLFMDSEEDAGRESDALDLLMEKRVEAIVLAATGSASNLPKIDAIRSSGTPLVLIDRRIDRVEADFVGEDSFSASKAAVSELIDRGHSRIGIAAGPSAIATARERLDGALAALQGRGLAPAVVFEGDFTRESGRRAVRELTSGDAPPTAVFSCNNEMTYGFYLGLRDANVDPASIEVVSFGDLEFSPLFRQRLTAIRQDPEWLGETAGELLLERIREPHAPRRESVRVPAIERKH